jgi:periplasmic divalent cation tolerance protein
MHRAARRKPRGTIPIELARDAAVVESSEKFVLVLTTAGSEDQAEAIARALVERRLAACVNVIRGVCSVFRWKDAIEREQEELLVIKTTEAALPRLRDAIRELHSYEVPEVLAIPIVDGSPGYLAWLAGSVDREAPSA